MIGAHWQSDGRAAEQDREDGHGLCGPWDDGDGVKLSCCEAPSQVEPRQE